MNVLSLTIVALLFCNVAFAECPNNVQRLSQGSSAPCSGWLVTEPTMQEMGQNKEQLEKYERLVKAQEHLQKLSDEEIEFYKKRSVNQQKQLEKSETQKFWVAAGAFALGVVLTGVAAKAAIEATR